MASNRGAERRRIYRPGPAVSWRDHHGSYILHRTRYPDRLRFVLLCIAGTIFLWHLREKFVP